MAIDGRDSVRACKCLNVRLSHQPGAERPPHSETTERDSEPHFTPVFVGEDGIVLAHPQLTLRARTAGSAIEGTSNWSQHVTLSCLICHILVYRVHQVVFVGAKGAEGPLQVGDEHAEQDALKSANGWVEVHDDCLRGPAIAEAELSPRYSRMFSVILPQDISSSASSSSLASQKSPTPSVSGAAATATSSEPELYLRHLKPLFLPPPFTPTHPAFTHLASVALRASESLRSSAEEELASIVRAKIAEVESSERVIKRQVELLWKEFKRGKASFDMGQLDRSMSPERRGSMASPTPVHIRDFVPMKGAPAQHPSPPPKPQISSLSASLKTSSFHHPRAVSPESNGVDSPSPSPARNNGDIKDMRRNMDQLHDQGVSFRYFVLEEEMKKRAAAQDEDPTETDLTQGAAEDKGAPTDQATGDMSKRDVPDKGRSRSNSNRERRRSHGAGDDGKQNGAKGKRKVTFDVKPEVVTIKRENNAEKAEEAESALTAQEEMIFNLEDDGAEPVVNLPSRPLRHSQEPIRPRVRPVRRKLSNTGLPESLSSLRPASLPTPSNMRSPTRPQSAPVTSDINNVPLIKAPTPTPKARNVADEPAVPQASFEDPYDAEILRLVAADMPSHRGAWRKDGKAWKTFVNRRDGKAHMAGEGILEENEERANDDSGDEFGSDDFEDAAHFEDAVWNIPLAGSLPINMKLPPRKNREELTLASYQPKTSLTDRPGALVPPLRQPPEHRPSSSATLRKAAYAERDRHRSMDPGALDFTLDDDEGVGERSDGDVISPEMDRGRQHALSILKARAELPSAGMWASLANGAE